MKVYIYALTDVFYYSFYIQGLYDVYGKKNIVFNISKFPDLGFRTCAIILKNKDNEEKRFIIDAFDSKSIRKEWLKWSDVYAKVNLNPTSEKESEKIISIGPSFGIRIWSLSETLKFAAFNYIKSKSNIKDKREFLANYWRQYKRLRIACYKQKKELIPNYVFFLSSIWAKEGRVNQARASFIKACKEIDSVNFEGGFAPRSDEKSYGMENFIYKKLSLGEYISKIKKSAVVFNTPAVADCHGWKLAEFLAMGKAIISTHHFNVLPEPLVNKKHIFYINDSKELKEVISYIIKNKTLRENLESNAQAYWNEFLEPKKVIEELTDF